VGGDPLDMVLRLVADGRLSADDAAPLLAALDPRPGAGQADPGPSATSGPAPEDLPPGSGRTLRVEVIDGGRSVVNLRLPLALGKYAIDRVPGLSGDQVARVREALSSGMTGPVLVVDDEDGGVRIAIE
jgi:hypothetical protein